MGWPTARLPTTGNVAVDAGFDVGFPGVLGATVQRRASRPQQQMALAELGADLHTARVAGWSPLLAAASMDDVEMVALLLRLGADPAQLRRGIDDDATALEDARRACAKDAAKLMKETANDENS